MAGETKMKDELKRLLVGFALNQGATGPAIDRMTAELGVTLPEDYLDLLRLTDGAEGSLGGHAGSSIRFWPAEEVPEANREYCVREYYPQLVLFGKDAATGAFAFDTGTSPMAVVEADFSDHTYCVKRGDDFLDFLRRMASPGVS